MATGKSDSDICFSKFAASIDFKCACTCMSAFTTETCVKLKKIVIKVGTSEEKQISKKIFFPPRHPLFFFYTLQFQCTCAFMPCYT